MKLIAVDHALAREAAGQLFDRILYASGECWSRLTHKRTATLWGVPRGGIPAAFLLAEAARSLEWKVLLAPSPDRADLIVDDVLDSGSTAERLMRYCTPFAALFGKKSASEKIRVQYGPTLLVGREVEPDVWLSFPWERDETRSEQEEDTDLVVRMLQRIGENPDREGLKETPARVVRAWREWFSGYQVQPKDVLKSFTDGAEQSDEMVVVQDIPVFSHCEHHLAPFFGTATVAYVPDGRIVGLSKLSRLVDVFSRRLQVQERLTSQIADALDSELRPKGVGVLLRCRHLCMESRGVERAGTHTVTSSLRGVMKSSAAARTEFLSIAAPRR